MRCRISTGKSFVQLDVCSICAWRLLVIAAFIFCCLLNFYPLIWVANVIQRLFLHHSFILWIFRGQYGCHTLIRIESYASSHVVHSVEDGNVDVEPHLLSYFAVMLVGSSSQIRDYVCINTRTNYWLHRANWTMLPHAYTTSHQDANTADANMLFTTDLTQKYAMRTPCNNVRRRSLVLELCTLYVVLCWIAADCVNCKVLLYVHHYRNMLVLAKLSARCRRCYRRCILLWQTGTHMKCYGFIFGLAKTMQSWFRWAIAISNYWLIVEYDRLKIWVSIEEIVTVFWNKIFCSDKEH